METYITNPEFEFRGMADGSGEAPVGTHHDRNWHQTCQNTLLLSLAAKRWEGAHTAASINARKRVCSSVLAPFRDRQCRLLWGEHGVTGGVLSRTLARNPFW